ncbi:HNH endonuclease signature motif containing protein [Sodalis endosymbiont of Spalangia cameroni]|uniref:HNH endonuclease signature motif containing protein n=1 Tax=Sodalis praecaptivus TaxID=1239307 RepID=UPI0031F7799B
MKSIKDTFDVDYLRKCIAYSPKTGLAIWKNRPREHFTKQRIWKMWNTSYADKVAGCMGEKGYLVIRIDGELFRLHRIIWTLFYGADPGSFQIDHINHIKTDNRILNLRLVDNKNNHMNMPMQKNNTSGEAGVCWHKQCSKWIARVYDNGNVISLGLYESYQDAVLARRKELVKRGYHKNHGVRRIDA